MLEKSDNISEIKRDLRGIKELSQKMDSEADEFSTLITKPNVNPDANMVVFVRNTHATLRKTENTLAKQIARLRTIK